MAGKALQVLDDEEEEKKKNLWKRGWRWKSRTKVLRKRKDGKGLGKEARNKYEHLGGKTSSQEKRGS